MKETILDLAETYDIPRETADNLITCESQWDINATNGNDRGLLQINSYWHPEVSDEVAYNPLEASRWAFKRIEDGYLYEYVCANCYAYIKAYFYKDLPLMNEIVPNSVPFESAVVIMRYGNIDHLAYLDHFTATGMWIKEANYEPAKISERELQFDDPHLIGFFDPNKKVPNKVKDFNWGIASYFRRAGLDLGVVSR